MKNLGKYSCYQQDRTNNKNNNSKSTKAATTSQYHNTITATRTITIATIITSYCPHVHLQLQMLAKEQHVTSFPTFYLFRKGERVGDIVHGANKKKIKEALDDQFFFKPSGPFSMPPKDEEEEEEPFP